MLGISISDKAKIRAEDELTVISWEKDGEMCYIYLIKVEDLAKMVKGMLGPLMREIMVK